jgi:hypothetical protein
MVQKVVFGYSIHTKRKKGSCDKVPYAKKTEEKIPCALNYKRQFLTELDATLLKQGLIQCTISFVSCYFFPVLRSRSRIFWSESEP